MPEPLALYNFSPDIMNDTSAIWGDVAQPPASPPDARPGHPRRRGRPVSVAARNAALATATKLLDERGLGGFSIDEVARRSKVSKATIYKHWSGGLPLAVEAYGAKVTKSASYTLTGDVCADLLAQAASLAAVYAGPEGRVIGQLLGAGASVEGGAELVRERFFAARRAESRRLIERGVADGLWRVEFDPDLLIELLFGPIVFRALNGESPLTPDEAVALARIVLRGLELGPGEDHRLAVDSDRASPGREGQR